MTRITPMDHAALLRNNDWVADAACAGHADPDLWYPESPHSEEGGAAKSICARCPVSTPCLTESLEMNDRYGIRSGVEEGQRLSLLRRDVIARWDEDRVVAALQGRGIRLSKPERNSVPVAAVIAGIDLRVWAPVLGIQRKRALALIKTARKDLNQPLAQFDRERRVAARLVHGDVQAAA
ncbi:WhiB family transcriptional regulator [Streptacidiphilus sp. MAP5-52]|uniref:WhiB family transcriptional regulator n=1 Tax=Streptacidiphilus sp. MAP5-52 TaxID=3156267 RepID=UPI003518D8DB